MLKISLLTMLSLSILVSCDPYKYKAPEVKPYELGKFEINEKESFEDLLKNLKFLDVNQAQSCVKAVCGESKVFEYKIDGSSFTLLNEEQQQISAMEKVFDGEYKDKFEKWMQKLAIENIQENLKAQKRFAPFLKKEVKIDKNSLVLKYLKFIKYYNLYETHLSEVEISEQDEKSFKVSFLSTKNKKEKRQFKTAMSIINKYSKTVSDNLDYVQVGGLFYFLKSNYPTDASSEIALGKLISELKSVRSYLNEKNSFIVNVFFNSNEMKNILAGGLVNPWQEATFSRKASSLFLLKDLFDGLYDSELSREIDMGELNSIKLVWMTTLSRRFGQGKIFKQMSKTLGLTYSYSRAG